MLIKDILLIFIGLTAGIVVAGAVFAFLTIIGVLVRLAVRTNTADHIHRYEDMAVLGSGVGNIIILFDISIPIGTFGLILIGLFSGAFVGCLAVALEEVIQVFPLFMHRIKLRIGMPILVLCLAIGKGLGAFYQLFVNR
ncbi:MAG: hypothetical protein K0R92_873 [Lachnospiraceae bacterium]|jgi:stage V sporulation protein AB|nr:hypothetical protein [Anaerocolumna sp.]MDF2609399.1 hypothetical protein [Lachnospiraceae bacterium]